MVACLATDTKGGTCFCDRTLGSPTTLRKVSSSEVMGATAFEYVWISRKNNGTVVWLLLIMFFNRKLESAISPAMQTMCFYPS